ncbi:MAG TPA: bifunctional GNAT family N-acetyltransferase/class I SAM-dependent methyltransferase [Candidatus Latescibacteria bacterium]|nr:bifunctional GNAT family N-acetyltransferase/class I SAM-dependent methyltransferase [Candidatus Latescibacterota bacterium]
MDDSRRISLRPVTGDNVDSIINLSDTLRGIQGRIVAPNATSLAEAYTNHHAWPRGIYAGDTAVGFLMLKENPDIAEYFLWRLMIGGEYQGKGYGRRAVDLLVDYVKTRPGATELLTCCVHGEGGPVGFYRALGFEPNGKQYDSLLGLVMPLDALDQALPADRPSEAVDDFPDYARLNRDNWNRQAPGWVEAGRRGWDGDPEWGIWHIPNAELPLLPDSLQGQDAIELGCGTGYVSSWLHRRGARVVAIDPSEEQLNTARTLAAEHAVDIEWIHGVAESVPKPDASFDFAISEYGAAIWADPYVWIPEAHRLLRPGGELVFFGNTPWSHVCTPMVDGGTTEDRLYHPYFGMHRIDWSHTEEGGGIEFCLSLGDWVRLFDDTGFDVIDYREVKAPDWATKDEFATTVSWARRFPAEHAWRLRRRG